MWRKKVSNRESISLYLFFEFNQLRHLFVKHLKYPIGRFSFDGPVNSSLREQWIQDIASLPIRLVDTIIPLSGDQLNIPYRKGGWTIRQVIHHLADSHLNAFIRTKLLLTEKNPTIKPYDQKQWAQLSDSELSIEPSLQIIKGTHVRWSHLLKKTDETDWSRTLNHPESGTWTLDKLTAQYAWHGSHHLAHINSLKDRKNWT